MTSKVAKAVVLSFCIGRGVVESWACLLVVVAIAGRRDQEHGGLGTYSVSPKPSFVWLSSCCDTEYVNWKGMQ